MIIKKGHKFYSVERISKKNVFSDSRAGNVFLHSRLIYCNPIRLIDCKEKFLQEVPLAVSNRGALDFRRIDPHINFMYAPIEGDFILKDGKFEHLLGHLYRVLASDHEKSKRNISWVQLEEIRKNSNYQMEFEDDYYYRFLKLADCQIEYRNEFRFYNLTKLKLFLSHFKDTFITTELNPVYFKVPTECIEPVGTAKAECGVQLKIYKVSSLPNDQLDRLAKFIKETPQNRLTQVEFGGKKTECFYIALQPNQSETGYFGIEDGSDIVYFAHRSRTKEFEQYLKTRKNIGIPIPGKLALS